MKTLATENRDVLQLVRRVCQARHPNEADLKAAIEITQKKYNLDGIGPAMVVMVVEMCSEQMAYNHSRVEEVHEALQQLRQMGEH